MKFDCFYCGKPVAPAFMQELRSSLNSVILIYCSGGHHIKSYHGFPPFNVPELPSVPITVHAYKRIVRSYKTGVKPVP